MSLKEKGISRKREVPFSFLVTAKKCYTGACKEVYAMKKKITALTIILALVLSLAACGNVRTAEDETPAAEAQTAETAAASLPEPSSPEEAEEETAVSRKDGERFEAVIMLEGMEETVSYKHVRNDGIGIRMDYDYTFFVRQSGPDRERFLSVWDDPEDPENYLDVTSSEEDVETAAASVKEELSQTYDLLESTREHAGAGSCLYIEASEEKGTGRMAEHLQAVYIIPAPDGCRIASAHYAIEEAEGFGKRFSYMVDTLTAMDRKGPGELTDEQAVTAIQSYCYESNPDLEGIVNEGEQEVSWALSSKTDSEIVVEFRSYTGAQIRYYIEPVSGVTYVTEFVSGITSEEERTDESLNVWDYLD